MVEDRRILAGVNMDGTVSGTVLTRGLNRPFLLLGSDRGDDDSWNELWSKLRGPRRELTLKDSGHMTFTDLEVLLPQAGFPPELLEPAYGTIDGNRAVAVERAYLVAFFDRYLRHRGGGLLDRPSARYPEMSFVR
jgi:predicted dienelactone hydrolase